MTGLGVLQTHESRLGEVAVVGLDGRFNLDQRQRTVGRLRQRLRLHAAQYRRAAGFVTVGVRVLSGDVLVTALTVGEDGGEVGLGAARDEQPGRQT